MYDLNSIGSTFKWYTESTKFCEYRKSPHSSCKDLHSLYPNLKLLSLYSDIQNQRDSLSQTYLAKTTFSINTSISWQLLSSDTNNCTGIYYSMYLEFCILTQSFLDVPGELLFTKESFKTRLFQLSCQNESFDTNNLNGWAFHQSSEIPCSDQIKPYNGRTCSTRGRDREESLG